MTTAPTPLRPQTRSARPLPPLAVESRPLDPRARRSAGSHLQGLGHVVVASTLGVDGHSYARGVGRREGRGKEAGDEGCSETKVGRRETPTVGEGLVPTT